MKPSGIARSMSAVMDGLSQRAGGRPARPPHPLHGARKFGRDRAAGAGSGVVAGGGLREACRSAGGRRFRGIQFAPTLRNYLERQTYRVHEAPNDFRERLQDSRLGDPVLVVPADFESELTAGEVPELELVASASNKRAESGVGAVLQLIRGFNQEQATLRLALRGVSPALLQTVKVQERDLADPAARAAQLATLLPFFVSDGGVVRIAACGPGQHSRGARTRLAGAAADEPRAATGAGAGQVGRGGDRGRDDCGALLL